jgi:hypothetical protein
MSDEFMESTSAGPKLPALKFDKIGDTHKGIVTEVRKLEDRDPAGNVKTFSNGDVRHVFVFTMDTAEGAQNLWVRGNMIKTIREAATQAGLNTLVGATLSVRYTGDGEKKNGFNAPKLYAAKVEAPKQDASAEMW